MELKFIWAFSDLIVDSNSTLSNAIEMISREAKEKKIKTWKVKLFYNLGVLILF